MPEATQAYTVYGHWPFPADMLRRDLSEAATPADEAKIADLTADHCPDLAFKRAVYSVDLVFRNDALRNRPLEERWASFGWKVKGGFLEAASKDREEIDRRIALRDVAMSKLTAEERDAVEWYYANANRE